MPAALIPNDYLAVLGNASSQGEKFNDRISENAFSGILSRRAR